MQAVPLELDMDPEAVRQKLLFSHTNWKSIFVDGVTSWYPNGASQPAQSTREQLWIDPVCPGLPAHQRSGRGNRRWSSRRPSPSATGSRSCRWTCRAAPRRSAICPIFPPRWQNSHPPLTYSDTIYPHPLAGTIGSLFDDRIFPTGLGQRQGTFKNVAVEEVAGRTCLVVDWSSPNGVHASRYWVDVETGVLLKGQDFGKGGGEDLLSEFVVNQVEYDLPLAESLFNLQLDAMPQWSYCKRRTPGYQNSPSQLPPFSHTAIKMDGCISLPATLSTAMRPCVCCACRAAAWKRILCPEAQEIATPFPLKFSLTPLVWSPQGDAAALAYPVSEDGNTAQLLLFNPPDESWTPWPSTTSSTRRCGRRTGHGWLSASRTGRAGKTCTPSAGMEAG